MAILFQSLCALFRIFFLIAAVRASTITVDDSDQSIQYRGAWEHNAIKGRENVNYGSTLTFTNVSGATVTYAFTGTGVSVFGAFVVPGTFSMHSTYSIDGGPPVDFEPADAVVNPLYRQMFFASDNLSDGEHTLVITNLGNQYWLDYLVAALDSSTSTSSPTTLHPSQNSAPPVTSQVPQPTPPPATTTTSPSNSSSPLSVSEPSVSSQSPQTATSSSTSPTPTTPPSTPIVTSMSNSSGIADSSSSTTQSASSSAAASPPDQNQVHTASSKLTVGVIIGIAVACVAFIVLLLLAVGCWRRHRRQRPAEDNSILPFDPGFTALASTSQSEKGILSREDYRNSSPISMLSGEAPVYSPTDGPLRSSEGSLHRSGLPEIRTNLDGTNIRTRMGGFEPLGSPSSASPLISRRLPDMQRGPDSSLMPNTEWRHKGMSEARRRSVDGGVRVAGGPPMLAREVECPELEVRSAASTLPPSYQLYAVS